MSPRFALAFAVPVLLRVPAVVAQNDRPQPGLWYCTTPSDDQHPTVYMTPVWETTALMPEVTNGYGQMLFEKYKYKDRVSCSRAIMGGATVEKLEGDQARFAAQLKGMGKSVVATGYTYDPARATHAFACSGFTRHKAGTTNVDSVFLSQVIRVPGNTQGPLSKGWFDYLIAEHHADPVYPGGCHMLPPDPGEHAATIDGLPKAWNTPSPVITRLAWQYRPAAAAALAADDAKPAYYCEMTGSKTKTWFVTAVIPTTPDFPRFDAQTAWQKWVRANVDADASIGGCDHATMRQETSLVNRRKEQYTNQGYTIKEVAWTYTPGAPPPAPASAAPAPAPPPAPAPSGRLPAGRLPGQGNPSPQPFYCQYLGLSPDAEGKYPLYQNEVFTAAVIAREVQQAWAKYVADTYKPGPNGNATCAQLPADPAQQKTVLEGMMAVPRTTMKVVKVTWKP